MTALEFEKAAPLLLTAAERELLFASEAVDIGAFDVYAGKCEAGRSRWERQPFCISIDAKPLALLAESARIGYRVHEFLSLDRPGDALRYLSVQLEDVGNDALQCIDKRLGLVDGHVFRLEPPPKRLPFRVLDAALWDEARDFCDEDARRVNEQWYSHRQTPYWVDKANALFAAVRAIQSRLRRVDDPLLRHEIALVDARVHRRDYFLCSQATGRIGGMPSTQPGIPPGLFELIVALARRDDVKSVSCPFEDYPLWRSLVWEQVQRARLGGCEPQKALLLSGPDGGIPYATARDWGGDIHIPYEGAREADLFIKPDWHGFDKEAALRAGSARAGFRQKTCRYLLIDSDQGDFERDERVRCEGWTLYGPKR